MAFRTTTGSWRSLLSRLGGNRPFATSTTPKMKTLSQTAGSSHANHSHSKYAITGEFAPVYIVLGMLMVALTIGTHTAKQQLAHCPNVSFSKKKRRSIPEVEDPDHVISSADKFLKKSFLRKVAHIQEHNRTLPDPTRPNPFTRSQNAETLKTVGVNPSRN